MIPGSYLTRVPLERYAGILNYDVYTNPGYLGINPKVRSRDLQSYVNHVTQTRHSLLMGLSQA